MTSASSDGILVAYNQGTQAASSEGYAWSVGTSMAAPHAAGLAALLMSRLGDLATPANVEARLKATARKYAWACDTKTCGSGVLDGPAALNFQTDREISATTPTIGGEAVVGNSLYADARNWTPSDITLSYQWYRNGTPIQGAQAAGYDIQAADVGTHLTATVTGSRFFGNSVSLTSAPTAAVVAAPVVPPYDPWISGQAIVGGLLTAVPGPWQPAPVTFAYQWLRAGQEIPGATAATYTVGADDKGKALSVRVTGTKDAYISAQRTSADTPPVATGAVPAAVQFTDKIGAPNDTYSVPSTPGVEYLVAGNVVPAGTYPGAGSVTVFSRATAGYALVDGSVTVWGFTFSPVVFNDVTEASAFSKEITWLAMAGISEGWIESDGRRTYRALQPISRDAMAAFLYRMDGSPQFTPPAVSPFSDVSTGQQFYKEMAWLADRNISTGWTEPDGSRSYRPLQTISRDAMAAFLYRMAGSPPYTPPAVSPFIDVSTGQQFYKEMAWLAQNGISTGWTEAGGARSYRPLQPISRDAMAAFLFRLDGLIH
jgi:serine protease